MFPPSFPAPCSPHVLSEAPVSVLSSQGGEGSKWLLPLSSFSLLLSQQAHWNPRRGHDEWFDCQSPQ